MRLPVAVSEVGEDLWPTFSFSSENLILVMVEEAGKEQARREWTRFEGVFLWEREGNVEKDYHQGLVRAQPRLETVG